MKHILVCLMKVCLTKAKSNLVLPESSESCPKVMLKSSDMFSDSWGFPEDCSSRVILKEGVLLSANNIHKNEFPLKIQLKTSATRVGANT